MPLRVGSGRVLAALAVLVAALWAALGAPAQAGTTPTREEAVAAGREAFLYGFPLLEFLRVRRENTSVPVPDGVGNAPLNHFSHTAGFARPEDRTVVAPNVDTLYSIAQLDLGRGPVVLSHPRMGSRYFVFQLVDPYTNVVGYIGSRTTGSRAGRFAITWDGARAAPPRGVRVVRSPYRRLWVIGRTLVTDDPADMEAGRRLMARYALVPLDRLDDPPPPPRGTVRAPRRATTPGGLAFLHRLGRALADNPPPARDRPLLARLARFGIGPGRSPRTAGLPADVLAGLAEGVDGRRAELEAGTRIAIFQQAAAAGGWFTPGPRTGAFGTDYLYRAQIALVGLGANTPEEATYPGALADSAGRLLNGAHRYRIVFRRGALPPARAFWSLTMYDLAGYLVDNPAGRHAIGDSHPPLRRRADGSIVVAIQRTRPAERDVNWLAPPPGDFRLNLRIYWPERSALTGAWRPPPVERVD